MKAVLASAILSALAGAAPANVLTVEGPAAETADKTEAVGSYSLPVGPWRDGAMKTLPAEGTVHRSAWRIDQRGLATLQILAPLRDQLAAQGYTTLYQCDTEACGGFDFRYAADILPEPEMHVDLGDFRYLAAEKTTSEGTDYVSLVVSRSSEAGFVQIVRVGPEDPTAMTVTSSTKNPNVLPLRSLDGAGALGAPEGATIAALSLPPAGAAQTMGERLETQGAVALDDLDFPTGSASLAPGDYPTLAALAAYLKDHPDRSVTIVGHTDAEGSLAANIALSKRRAASVLDRLVADYGVDRNQLAADGVGFLSPRASNLTEDGRSQNRRVEVMLTSTQ